MIRVFGLVGLVVALAIVGLLVKKQLTTTTAVPAVSVQGRPPTVRTYRASR